MGREPRRFAVRAREQRPRQELSTRRRLRQRRRDGFRRHTRRVPMKIVLAACALWAHVAVPGAAAAAVRAIDDAGETLTLAAPARRIVSLAPNATELLFAAGAG